MYFKLVGVCGKHSPLHSVIFFYKSFLENKKDREKGTQNEEGSTVKQKQKTVQKCIGFFIIFPWDFTSAKEV